MEEKKKTGGGMTARYAFIQCFYNMSYCCLMCFASVFLLSRDFTNSQVGITLTLSNALSIICQPALASFADRTKKFALRNIVAAMVAVTAVMTLLLMVLPSVVLPTMILYVLMMCFFALYPSLITSMAMEHIDQGVKLNFSLARGFGSLAFALLTLALGFLVDDFGAWIILPISLSISVINVVLISVFPKAEKKSKKGGLQQNASGLLEFARRNKRFMGAVVSIVLLYFSHILINTYTIQIVRNVGGTNGDMGVASALGGFLELPAMALFPFLLKRMKSAGLILKVTGVFFVLKALLTLLAPNMAMIYGAQCLQFFAFAMYVPASVYYADRVIGGADRVKGQACMAMAAGISGMLGNAAGGFLLDAGGVSLMLTVGLAVSVVGLALLLFIAPSDRGEAVSLQEAPAES